MTPEAKALLFGDYEIVRIRGRVRANCYRCNKYSSSLKRYAGQVESAVRQHIKGVHHIYDPHQDARQTWLGTGRL